MLHLLRVVDARPAVEQVKVVFISAKNSVDETEASVLISQMTRALEDAISASSDTAVAVQLFPPGSEVGDWEPNILVLICGRSDLPATRPSNIPSSACVLKRGLLFVWRPRTGHLNCRQP